MSERLSRFGIGPRIVGAVLACAIAAAFLSYEFPQVCLIPALRRSAVAAIAWALVGTGVAIWFAGAIVVMRAYNRDELVTTGVYSLVRHPMYTGWIVLILPGIVLLTTCWPLLAAPLIAYAIFKHSIRREDEYLAKRFGRSYLDYRGRVNEMIPIPRFDRR